MREKYVVLIIVYYFLAINFYVVAQVGINTTTPVADLDVRGNLYVGDGSISIGIASQRNLISGMGGSLNGYDNILASFFSVVSGNRNIVAGDSNTVSGENSLVVGGGNVTNSGSSRSIIGGQQNNLASGSNACFMIGVSNTLSGTNSSIISGGGINMTGNDTAYAQNLTVLGTFTNISDKRFKSHIEEIPYGLHEILKLNPTIYHYKGREKEGKYLGLIAQNVQETIPEVVSVVDNKEGYLGVSYVELIPILIKSIQQQQEQIKDLRKEISEMKK